MNNPLILLLWFWLIALTAHAQHPVYRLLSKPDGLPSNTVYASLQDKNGYLWLGTEKGLVKFDGHLYKLYTHPNMTGQAVSDLHLDGYGRVWCQNFIGQHFYALNDSLYHIVQFKTAGFYAPIVIDKQNNIYVSCDSSVRIFNASLQVIDSFKVGMQSAAPFLFDNKYTYSNGIMLANYSGKQVSVINNSLSLNPYNARSYTFKVANKIFVYEKPSNRACLYQLYPTHSMHNLAINLGSAVIQTVSVTQDSLIWLNTTDGVFVLNNKLNPIAVNQPLFKGYSISGVIQDKNGAYWVSTLGKGILYIPQLNSTQYRVSNELFSRSCMLKNGQLLVGGNSGFLYSLLPAQSTFKPFIKLKIKQQVSAMLVDTTNNVLLVAGGSLSIYQNNKHLGFVNAAVKEVKRVNSGTYLIAASGFVGVVCMNGTLFEQKWRSKLALISSTAYFKVYRILSDAEGLRNLTVAINKSLDSIYVGTAKGLLLITPTLNKFISYQQQAIITTNLEWVNHDLYLSTENRGLLKIADGKLVWLSKEFPQLGNMVTRLKYANSTLYILAENGAFAYYPNNNKLQSIVTGFGQNGVEEYRDIDVDNEAIYLSGADLVKVIPLHTTANKTNAVRLFIDQVFCNYAPLNNKHAISLSATENNIRIVFNLPWLNLNDKLTFTYKLNDGPWETIENGSRELNLLSLSPNHYSIKIKAQSATGFVSNTEEVLFVILPPIWERWWFYMLMIVVLGTSFYVLYAYRIKQINKQNKLLSENLALETNLQKSMLSSIKAQMNPHFIFNALNTIQSYIYLNDKQNASRFLTKFSSLTRKILEMSNADTITLEVELSSLRLYLELEKMRFEESFMFNIEVADDIQPEQIRLPSMILQPYVENAIKHGLLHKDDDRKLFIGFKLSGANLVVTIDDNGIGRKRSAEINATRSEQHQSFSTHANQTRLELLMQSKNTKLVVEYLDKQDANGQALGTVVTLVIPLVSPTLVN